MNLITRLRDSNDWTAENGSEAVNLQECVDAIAKDLVELLPEKKEVWPLSDSEVEQVAKESFNEAVELMESAIQNYVMGDSSVTPEEEK